MSKALEPSVSANPGTSSAVKGKRAIDMMGYYGGWSGMGGLGWLAMLVFWVAVIALVVWAVRSFTGGATRKGGSATPLDVLNQRFAAGEISQADYEQAKRTLQGPTPVAR
jgi:putative membrane protein